MNDELAKATTVVERVELLTKQIVAQEQVVFALRYDLLQAEAHLEGLFRLREQLGAPTLSHKHTLRGRLTKYLTEHPNTTCSELASALGTPVTTVNMCLHRNKELFEQTPNKEWKNK